MYIYRLIMFDSQMTQITIWLFIRHAATGETAEVSKHGASRAQKESQERTECVSGQGQGQGFFAACGR